MPLLIAAVVLLYVLVLVLVVLVVVLYRQFGLVYLGSRRVEELRGPAVGASAPTGLRVTSPDDPGAVLRLDWDALQPEGATLVLLGGQACTICEHLLHHLDEALSRDTSGARVIFIDNNPGTPVDLPVPSSESGRWQHWRSSDGSVHAAFDIDVSPFAFVIDHAGIIRAKGIVSSAEAVVGLLQQAGLSGEPVSPDSSRPDLLAAEQDAS